MPSALTIRQVAGVLRSHHTNHAIDWHATEFVAAIEYVFKSLCSIKGDLDSHVAMSFDRCSCLLRRVASVSRVVSAARNGICHMFECSLALGRTDAGT